jgi:hypothetical protein
VAYSATTPVALAARHGGELTAGGIRVTTADALSMNRSAPVDSA